MAEQCIEWTDVNLYNSSFIGLGGITKYINQGAKANIKVFKNRIAIEIGEDFKDHWYFEYSRIVVNCNSAQFEFGSYIREIKVGIVFEIYDEKMSIRVNAKAWEDQWHEIGSLNFDEKQEHQLKDMFSLEDKYVKLSKILNESDVDEEYVFRSHVWK